jgi:coenzyme F420-reducing hydrogenase gamma subunit
MSPSSSADTRPTLAVWKFASCDGCQLSLLDCERELLALAGAVRIAHFTEMSRTTVDGPYDISLVEGSITTPDDAERIKEVRSSSRYLVTIGACAVTGGIQALRNFADAGLRPPRVLKDTREFHADLRARARRPRTARMPDWSRSTARGAARLSGRASAGYRGAFGVPGV